MDIDEETSNEYREDTKLYLTDRVITPNGEGKVVGFDGEGNVKVWVEDDNQHEWFGIEEVTKI